MATSLCPLPLLPTNPSAADFLYFLRQFENFLVVNSAQDQQKLPLLLNALGRDGLAIYDGLKDPKSSYTEAVDRLKEYYVGSTSVMLKRKKFFECRQQVGEAVSAFACRLRRLASECNFPAGSENLRDIFIIGVRDNRIGERLLSEDPSKFTFDQAVARAETVERAGNERTQMQAKSEGISVDRVEHRTFRGGRSGAVNGPPARKNNFATDRKCKSL